MSVDAEKEVMCHVCGASATRYFSLEVAPIADDDQTTIKVTLDFCDGCFAEFLSPGIGEFFSIIDATRPPA